MGRKAQVSIEYLGVFALAVVVMVAAISLLVVQPQVAYSTKKQQSDQYWASARPFAVVDSVITKDRAVLQLQNSDPVSLTIRGISIQGTSVNFSKVSAPFNGSAVPMCVGSGCTMQMPAGELDAVVADSSSMAPALERLCFSGSTFQEGRYYEANLSITYQDSSGNGAVETSNVPLIGQCSSLNVTTTLCTLNGAACSGNGDCCSGMCSASGACVGKTTGNTCNSNSQCYSLHCSFEGQCVCLVPGTACTNYTECCSNICLSSACKPPLTLSCPYQYAAVNSSYSSSASATGGSGSGYAYSISNSNLASIGLSYSGGSVSGKPGAPGTATFSLNVTDSAGDKNSTNCSITANYYEISIACPSPYAAVGSSYSSFANASGGSGSYSYSLVGSSLPSGLSMLPDGSVSGTPSGAAGSYSYFVLGVDNAGESNTQNCSITVYPQIIIYCPDPSSTEAGLQYSATVDASGGSGPAYTFDIACTNSFPFTPAVSGSTLSGTPAATGTGIYSLTATDSKGNSKSQSCSITVYSPIAFTCPSSSASTNTTYLDNATASGGSGAWGMTASNLTDGFASPANGANWVTIAAAPPAPTAASNVSVVINAADPVTGLSHSKSCPINVCATAGYNCPTGSECCAGLVCAGGTCGSPPPAQTAPVIGACGAQGASVLVMQGINLCCLSGCPAASNGINYNYTWLGNKSGSPVLLSPTASAPGTLGTGSIAVHTPIVLALVAWNAYGQSAPAYSNAVTTISPPTASASASVSGQSATITATATVDALAGISTLDVYLDGTDETTCYISPCVYTATGLDAGTSHTYYAEITDGENDVVDSSTGTFSIDQCAGVTCNNPPGTCYDSSGTCSGGTCSYDYSAAGTWCSSSPHCNGDTYYSGYGCDGSGSCNSDYGDSGCCLDSYCSAGQSCNTTTHSCYTPGSALSIACPTATTGTVGTAYSSLAVASGGSKTYSTYTISSGSLPSGGMSINQGTGLITGTPNTTGTYTFTVGVFDNSGAHATSGSCTITISPPAAPTITVNCPTATATSGSSYSSSASASGGTSPYTYTITGGNLTSLYDLTGMTTAGLISDHVYMTGAVTFTVKATDKNGYTGSASCTITSTATPVALAIACPTATNGTVGTAYSSLAVASGGSNNYSSYWMNSGLFPNNVTISTASGTIHGTPTAAGTSTFTVGVTDSESHIATSGTCTITISPAPTPLSIACPTATSGVVGTAYSSTMASGGSTPYSYSVGYGSIPSGLALSTSTGKLEGTPTTAAAYTFAITVTDNAGHSATVPQVCQVSISATCVNSGYSCSGTGQGNCCTQTPALVCSTTVYTCGVPPDAPTPPTIN